MEEKLPEGWVETTLGTLGEYMNGYAFNDELWSKTGRPIIRIQDLTGSRNTPNYFDGEIDQKYLVRTGDFLIAWSATLGAFIWYGPEAWLNQHIFKVVSYIDKLFHYYLVQTVIDDLYHKAHGSGMVHVTRGIFEATRVPLAPLPEQTRIVSVIEQQFTCLDSAIASLKNAQAKTKLYRASLLKAAVEGELTKEWRADHPTGETGPQLLTRILKERRARWEEEQLAKMREKGITPKDDKWKQAYKEPQEPDVENLPVLPEGWGWATVEQVVLRSEYGTSVKCDYNIGGIPVLRIPNIAAGKIDLSDMKYAIQPIQIDENSALQMGDLLVCRTNGSISLIGKAALVKTPLKPFHTFASYLLRFRLFEANLLPQWLHLFVSSPQGRDFIETNSPSSAGQHNISLSLLHSMPFPLPHSPNKNKSSPKSRPASPTSPSSKKPSKITSNGQSMSDRVYYKKRLPED